MRRVGFIFVLHFMLAVPALASECRDPAACCDQDHGCCARCGAKKVCKVVCEMEEVKKTCWMVECEEFCAPLPAIGKSRCDCCGAPDCGGNCGGECGERRASGLCNSLLGRPLVPPQCGKVRCRKTLHKKEITCQVPVYKCVVVPTCRCCEGPRTDDPGDLAAFGFAVPPMPPAETKQ